MPYAGMEKKMLLYDTTALKSPGRELSDTEKILVLNCAPVLTGSRYAGLVTVSPSMCRDIYTLLDDTNISCSFWSIGGDKVMAYLSNMDRLDEYLRHDDVAELLDGCGYGCRQAEKFDILERRIMLYGEGKAEFPHEIGVFLGYPSADVRGFIENSGKNFALAGYWKVYADVQTAAELFREYDEDRKNVIKGISDGGTLPEVIAECVRRRS